MALSMARATGQRRLRISLYGLWRRHEAEETGYMRFMDVVEELLRCGECLEKLREKGVEKIDASSKEPYMVVDVDKLQQLLRECR
ncbi:hypothetical protein CF15_00385 [Pyrodictium occultum]|uniref:Uncharacterized protein n=1 Tax=Pyrodictium occultum TaxID=2309 RepID=A0A0V8RTH0_PYROC|nr:hypothetical protein [Pyrodictium occultum]KSW11361.1 hypothetical protein CF15_00385 [Pyrodictium occultum]